ncbi:MAG: hypothetical protein ABFC94_18545 [Syntrophomonas sp.]
MTDLEDEKYKLEIRIKELSLKGINTAQLTPEQMKKLFSVFKQFVMEKNLPECKKFIDHYVEKVVVFHDHVELTLKVVVIYMVEAGGTLLYPKSPNNTESNE